MISVKFYIEQRKSPDGSNIKESRPLILSICYLRNRLKIYLGRKVHAWHWDKEKQRVTDLHPESRNFNLYLESIEKEILRLYSVSDLRNKVSGPADFKTIIKSLLKYSNHSFFDTFLEFIELNNQKWSNTTYKKIKTLYNQLRQFQGISGSIINLETIDKDFAERLVQFYRDRNLKDITIKKNIDLIRWFMNWASREKKLIGTEYREIKFNPVNQAGGLPQYLYWDELIFFFNYPELNTKESWARDIFCFIVFTGIRFSEICRLKKTCVDENIISLSTGQPGKITQSKFTQSILKKYKNKYYRDDYLFPPMNLVTFHKYLRNAALKANLMRQVSLSGTNGKTSVPYLKDIISAEMAINTYVANSVKLDIPYQLIAGNISRFSSGRYKLILERIASSSQDHVKKFNLLYESL